MLKAIIFYLKLFGSFDKKLYLCTIKQQITNTTMEKELVYHYCDNIELGLTYEDAHDCSHSGSCDAGCERVVSQPYVKKQLAKYSDKELRKSVKAYGVDDVDSFDRHRLETYVVWLVAGSIVEDEYTENH